MSVDIRCGTCKLHDAEKRCIRQPASPNHDDENMIVTWSKTEDWQRCSYWSDKVPVKCGDCVHWMWPIKKPILNLREEKPEWWDRAGYCTNYPPGAGFESYRYTFWGVTHESSACGHGEEPEIIPE